MEKDKEVCVLSKDRFIYYWDLLLLNYNQKNTHDIQEKRKLTYAVFRDVSEKDFKVAILNTMKYQQYFPNINEIYKYLPNKTEQKLNEWKSIEKEIATDEEQKELKKILEIK